MADEETEIKLTTPDDRRRAPRFDLPAQVALLDADARWRWYPIQDISAVGLAVAGGPQIAVGQRLPIQVPRVGAATGCVVRTPSAKLCLDLQTGDVSTDLRHRRIAWLASDAPDHRRHQRVRPAPGPGRALVVPIVTADGRQSEARLADVSAGGLRVTGLADAATVFSEGPVVTVAGVSARLVWSSETDAAFAFAQTTDVARLRLEAKADPQSDRRAPAGDTATP